MAKKAKSAPDFDVTSHVLVPKHTKLTKKEKQELFEKYNISHGELLKIRKDDPAIAHLGAEEGDVVKVHREGGWQSMTAGHHDFYRGVVDAQK